MYVFVRMTKLPCEEKLRLLVEFQSRVQAYADSIGRMTTTGLTQAEIDELSAAIESTREACREARARLDQHTAEHGC